MAENPKKLQQNVSEVDFSAEKMKEGSGRRRRQTDNHWCLVFESADSREGTEVGHGCHLTAVEPVGNVICNILGVGVIVWEWWSFPSVFVIS